MNNKNVNISHWEAKWRDKKLGKFKSGEQIAPAKTEPTTYNRRTVET